MKRILFGWASLALLLAGAVQADYIYTRLDVQDLDAAYYDPTQAFGINNAGQIVGTFLQQNAHFITAQTGFLLSGSYRQIEAAPFPANNWATGINGSGQIVGYTNQPAPYAGFLLNQGTYTTLMVPNSRFTQAFGINASGQIVGTFGDATSPTTTHGFLLSGGSYTTLNAPGSATSAAGINASGQIVGYYRDGTSSVTHGFLLNGGIYTTLDVPGALSTKALGINDAGQIVGEAHGRGFVLSDGVYTAIDFPGSTATVAEGINDSGIIVGYYWDSDGIDHGFLARPRGGPVPEPSTLLLLAVGTLGLIGWAPWRSKRIV